MWPYVFQDLKMLKSIYFIAVWCCCRRCDFKRDGVGIKSTK